MRLLILVFILAIIKPFASELDARIADVASYRLPRHVSPSHYDIHIKTYLPGYGWKADENKLTFEGNVNILLDIKETTDKLVLHSSSLNIISATFQSDEQNVSISHWNVQTESQFLTFYLNNTVKVQSSAGIQINFQGKVRTDGLGLFATNSTREDGTVMTNFATQFETIFARNMIPCFDEPEFKATWNVSLEHPTGSTALSNGIEVESKVNDDWKTTTYKKTLKMSSYILALFIGDIQFKETILNNGVRIRVYTDPVNIDRVDHALNISRIVLEGFERQFGIRYPMEKLDFVSVQNFKFGAMENWGLVIHNAYSLIGDPMDVTEIVIHEIAHQWFGNLVTMKYWDHIWLNEGFASYMTSYGLTFLDPDYQRDTFYLNCQFNPQINDGGVSLNFGKNLSSVMNNAATVYMKGCSFVRMLENIFGTEYFNEAIKFYLEKNQYDNVDDNDLYEAFRTSSETLDTNGKPFDIEKFARCWTHQNGFPTIQVSNDNGIATLTQSHLYEPQLMLNECDYKWDIPIWYQEPGEARVQMAWLNRNSTSLELVADDSVIINANSIGYYEVLYSDKMYEKIAEQVAINVSRYSVNSLRRTLHDVFRYSRDGLTPFHNAFIIAYVLVFGENEILRHESVLYLVDAVYNTNNKSIVNSKDIETVKGLVNQIENFELFPKCVQSQTFSSCYQKRIPQNINLRAIMQLKLSQNTMDLIVAWAENGVNEEAKLGPKLMLGCSTKENLKKISGKLGGKQMKCNL